MNICNAAMKVILLTGATDGIGFEAAKLLVEQGHRLVLPGRNPKKIEKVKQLLGDSVETHVADLANLKDVESFAKTILEKHDKIDVLMNNAGVFKVPQDALRTADGLDARFAVNTIAPYYLTKKLLPLIPKHGRVINLSSAAQAPVDLDAMATGRPLSDNEAYAQSKLGIAMWSYALSLEHKDHTIVAVNPASFIGTNMVKEAYGVAGKDISIGANILRDAALSKKFGDRASGKYFDNDVGEFRPPHPDGTNKLKTTALCQAMDAILATHGLN